MKKIAVMLFLSFLVGMVNASTMPVSAGDSAIGAQNSSHSHCEGAVKVSSHDDSRPPGNLSVSHYCCSAIAVLNNSAPTVLDNSSISYQLGERSKPISNITESIYKPPKTYL